MKLGLGIDTGGTFTDSVILGLADGHVHAKAKARTTRENLRIGIDNSLSLLDHTLFPKIHLVSLSTTLATNSIVEGKGSRVGLIVIVPNPATFSFSLAVPAEEVVIIQGAHDKRGITTAELDIAGASQAIGRMAEKVDAFAVSGYFSIYNAEHEITVRKRIHSLCGLPVVCGHELSVDIGMMERAVTAVLNARLLPVIQELLDAVQQTLHKRDIFAPIMVVKGDGSLIGEEMARTRPVETVLSGPAASVVGACELTGIDDAVVVDMGGTTTDIAVVKNGAVTTNHNGAMVGGWQTKVHAIDMSTVGLGGDSMITVTAAAAITIGPRRALPFCIAAKNFPAVKEALYALTLLEGKKLNETELVFYTLVKMPNFPLSIYEQRLLRTLDKQVLHKNQLDGEELQFVAIDRFVELGYIAEVCLTPTDILHARECLSFGDRDAARMALGFVAKKTGLEEKDLLRLISTEIVESLKFNIAARVLREDPRLPPALQDGNLALLGYLLREESSENLSAQFSLKKRIIAVGAPVQAYFPQAAVELGAELIIPKHSEVANAVGAITGSIIEKSYVTIRPDKSQGFVVIAATEQRRFQILADALSFGETYVQADAAQRMALSGGNTHTIMVAREEKTAPLAPGWGDAVFIEIKLTATAIGKPAL